MKWSMRASPKGSQRRVQIRTPCLLLLGAALLAACAPSGDVGRVPTDLGSPSGTASGGQPSGCPGSGNQASCPPVPTGGRYTLSGLLTLRTTSGTAPLANVGVGGFAITTNGTGYGLAPAVTDAHGRYQFTDVPDGVVVLYGGAPHAYQPCAAIGTVHGANAVKDIELLDSAATRPAATADSPTLSGVVYRRTGTGKQPVAGAVIEFEYPPVPATTATTDAQGRYSLCQLPTGRGGLDVWLNGVLLGGAVVNINGDAVLDLTF